MSIDPLQPSHGKRQKVWKLLLCAMHNACLTQDCSGTPQNMHVCPLGNGGWALDDCPNLGKQLPCPWAMRCFGGRAIQVLACFGRESFGSLGCIWNILLIYKYLRSASSRGNMYMPISATDLNRSFVHQNASGLHTLPCSLHSLCLMHRNSQPAVLFTTILLISLGRSSSRNYWLFTIRTVRRISVGSLIINLPLQNIWTKTQPASIHNTSL